MDSIQVSIATTQEGIEAVCACLRAMDIEQVEIVDDMASIHSYLEANATYWDYVDEQELAKNGGETCVRLYVNDDIEGKERLKQIEETITQLAKEDFGLDLGSLAIQQEMIHEEDWANNWRQFYKPISVGERLIVVPAWEENPDTDRVMLRLEPGLVFGTGEHQTTQLCLVALEKQVKQGIDVLDLGCGSGILSITSLLLGAKHATAIDIDPNSKNIAYENAQLNDIDPSTYHVMIGDLITEKGLQEKIGNQQYDVIVANIVANVIIGLIPYVKKWLKKDGVFISSGIIDERLEDVQKELDAHGFVIQSIDEKDGWECVMARK